MNLTHWISIVVIGFVGCAEFGSFAFVHPVLRRLDPESWITIERGLLRTFGRVMPIGMTLAPILAGSTAGTLSDGRATTAWVATATLGVALATTIAVNVRINLATRHWDPADLPENWRQQRRQWDIFQGLRATLQLVGFLVITAAIV